MKARINEKITITAAGGPGRACSEPGGRIWLSADHVSQAPAATSGRLSQERNERPPINAATPAASCSGHRKDRSDGCAAGGNLRNAGIVSAMATTVRGMIEKKAHRQPNVLAINPQKDGPNKPGPNHAPASNASTRARPDSG